MKRIIIFAAAFGSFTGLVPLSAQAQVNPNAGCGRQPSYEACVKCNQMRGAAGATGGHQWCSRNWRAPASGSKKNRDKS